MFVPKSNSLVAGRYELIEELGRGGMGVVWRARHTNLGMECAVKFIHAVHADNPEHRRRFVREARAGASLKSPNSVSILDVDEWEGTLFIAMELLSGESLESRLEREGSLTPELTLEIVEQVARGLNKAHGARLVHRDLKPENIFLVDDEPMLVKLLDFGIAKHLDTVSALRTASGALVGTPWYMSPEQADGSKAVDFRTDLWALGAVAFRCLTGRLAFDGEGLGQVLLRIMQAPIPAPRAINPSLPAAVDEWWFSVMQREPEQRPASVLAVASALRSALTQPAVLFSPARAEEAQGTSPSLEGHQVTLDPVSATSSRRSKPRLRFGVAVTGLALLTVGVATLFRYPRREAPPPAPSAPSPATAPATTPAASAELAPIQPASITPPAAPEPTPAAAGQIIATDAPNAPDAARPTQSARVEPQPTSVAAPSLKKGEVSRGSAPRRERQRVPPRPPQNPDSSSPATSRDPSTSEPAPGAGSATVQPEPKAPPEDDPRLGF